MPSDDDFEIIEHNDDEEMIVNESPVPSSSATASTKTTKDKYSPSRGRRKVVTSIPTWQQEVRQFITPYLPPPVIQAWQRLDPHLEPYLGSDGTITILVTLLFAFLVRRILGWISNRLQGRALADEDEYSGKALFPQSATPKETYEATVLFVGPPGGGKTRLFYRLCYGPDYGKLPTLMSLQANVGICPERNLRYMDWPGYAGLLDNPTLQSIVQAPQTRIVLVLDATQPVAAAADVFVELFQLLSTRTSSRKKTSSQPKVNIFVACHKTDFPKAKNWRRIKIQLRTELERLLQVHANASSTSSDKGNDVTNKNISSWWLAGKAIDLDDLPMATLHFYSTTSEGKLSTDLLEFCETGVIKPRDEVDVAKAKVPVSQSVASS